MAESELIALTEVSWRYALSSYLGSNYWNELVNRVEEKYQTELCFPIKENIFRAFELTPLSDVRVVILGQDPYHAQGQANGLAFSVFAGQKPPPSLRNILKEVWDDVGGSPREDLSCWAEQGVFLLNTVLTVESRKPGSHKGIGWQEFTDEVIRVVSSHQKHVVYMLWGNHAQAKETLIDQKKHLILKAPHPSPLSAYHGFGGCRHFSKANDYLLKFGLPAIHW